MIILGVFRIRAAHQRTMRDQENGKENEMDWDDSALTITVNPMEVKNMQSVGSGAKLVNIFLVISQWKAVRTEFHFSTECGRVAA